MKFFQNTKYYGTKIYYIDFTENKNSYISGVRSVLTVSKHMRGPPNEQYQRVK